MKKDVISSLDLNEKGYICLVMLLAGWLDLDLDFLDLDLDLDFLDLDLDFLDLEILLLFICYYA
jgi:hypothetical protein